MSGLSFKRNRKEGGGDSSASSPRRKSRSRARSVPAAKRALPRRKAAATPESQEPQAKGAEAGAACKGGDTEEEAGPPAEPSTPSGPESGPTPAGAEQNE